MEREGLKPVVIDTFSYYYEKVVTGETGLIPDKDIEAVSDAEVPDAEELGTYADAGKAASDRAVMIVLNGGLGTSMGLTGPKSLLIAKDGKTFLEVIVDQARKRNVRLALMNSFSTHEETVNALSDIAPGDPPLTFLQHKFPKILQADLSPAQWPEEPELEWNPPGHGDIYTALLTSGMLDKLLDEGIEYAFICNSDNLGASMKDALLGYFSGKGFPFMMEVARRTPADVKGGHLARHKNGRLILRESAQCPEDELDAFRDIERYRFFNTNNLWVNLKYLKDLIEREKTIRLPMILNPKTLDPRDKKSPPVYQVETAMGAAISLFEGAAAVCVPRDRFFPVKKCNDLLAVRSDRFIFSDKGKLVLNPDNQTDDIKIDLDSDYYKLIDDFNERFPDGPPSLMACESLEVKGDVRFEGDVVMKGRVRIENARASQATVANATMEGDVVL
jgi:UTP--glucose-1-phosphate uridylyltransferase